MSENQIKISLVYTVFYKFQEKAYNSIWASVTLAGTGRALDCDCDCLSGGKYLLQTMEMAFVRPCISKFSRQVGWGGGPTIYYQPSQLTNH